MASKGLESSMWASRGRFLNHYSFRNTSQPVPQQSSEKQRPTTPPTMDAPSAAPMRPSSSIGPVVAFHRFEQAYQRLRWKYIDLETSYKRALSPEPWGFSMQDAERNFKVDFYEFYVWIEQTLVLALLIFGITVPREKQSYGDGGHGDGFRGPRTIAAHSYHHNVLRALDEEDSPLHHVLGAGDVNHALWKAKELRNRWKDSAEGRETPPLKMYDLTWIVTTILGGLQATYGMAAERVRDMGVNDGNDGDMKTMSGTDEWEWMVEMDWEP